MKNDSSHTGAPVGWAVSGCPHCASLNVKPCLSIHGVPTQDGVLWESRAAALASPVGDIDLVMCSSCGLVGNQSYEREKVEFGQYDVATDYSPAFQDFLKSLALRLVDRYQLQGRRILEIGCGRAYFLRTICDAGGNTAIGIDPSQTAVARADPHPSVRLINDLFSEEYLDQSFDLFVCRQVLDILPDQPAFLRLVHEALSRQPPGAVAYFEVPNAAYTFGHGIVWNVVYEHRIWYFKESLRKLFELSGFEVLSENACWNDEYLGIEVRIPGDKSGSPSLGISGGDFSGILGLMEQFRDGYKSTVAQWGTQLAELSTCCSRIALWGAGARAIALLAAVPVADKLAAVVDINPNRQGRFLPRSGLEVLPPDALVALDPDLILISNPTYSREIRAHALELGLQCRFVDL